MPWTLYRYMLAELGKLLAITAVVLVFVLAVAAAIKPLSDGLLGPWSLVKFVSYMAPAMLSLALPFAGAFVGTLLFHRMVTDNEIQVCRASGMSYLLILAPVLILGLVLMLGMFYLSNWTIPRSCERAEHALEKDVLAGLVSKIQSGEPIRHGKLILYADAANEGPPKSGSLHGGAVPQRLIALGGVVVGQVNDEDRIRRMGSAERADLLLYHAGGESWIVVQVKGLRYLGEGERADFGRITPLGPYLVENPFRERLSFLSMPRLRALRQRPEGYRHVRTAKQRIVAAMAREELTRRLHAGLDSGGRKVSLQGLTQDEKYVIKTGAVVRHAGRLELTAPATQKVQVVRWAHGLLRDRGFEAKRAIMEVVMDPSEDEEPRIDVRLFESRAIDADGSSSGSVRPRRALDMMAWPDPDGIAKPLRAQPLRALLATAPSRYRGAQAVASAAEHAEAQIEHLMRKVRAESHERASLAVGCSLLVVLGAVLALKLQRRTALGVYFWTFLMAAVALIVTRSGEHLVTVPGLPFGVGAAVIWSGNLLVAGAILTSYWRLEKN